MMPNSNSSNDPLAPGSGDDGLAGPIACVTLITRSPDRVREFYSSVMQMECKQHTASPAIVSSQRQLWALPADFEWTESVYYRPGLPDVPLLRVLASEQAAEPVRPGMASRLEGGLSVGFAMRDLEPVVAQGAELGFETTAGIGALDMQRADGSAYQALECHFRAPDDVYALGVSRPPDLAPVGPIEADRTVGGPSYTGQVMNHRKDTLRFYTDVLGYEVRRSMSVSGPVAEKGLALPPGTAMDFLQLFAPGSTSGYFIVLDFGDAGQANEATAAPHAGVVMWTFPVKSVAAVAEGAESAGCTIIAGPLTVETPYFGTHKALTVRSSNGFVVECIER